MLVLRIHPEQGKRKVVGHFAVEYDLATPEAVAQNPQEILTAIWAICRINAQEWMESGYTRVTLIDLFRDRIIWDAALVTCLSDEALNGIEWLRQQILTQKGV